jgi:hypothetical protein
VRQMASSTIVHNRKKESAFERARAKPDNIEWVLSRSIPHVSLVSSSGLRVDP